MARNLRNFGAGRNKKQKTRGQNYLIDKFNPSAGVAEHLQFRK